MDFIFAIQNHHFRKETPWFDLHEVEKRSWFLSIDIHNPELFNCSNTEYKYTNKDITLKSARILTDETQETQPYWEAFIDMSYSNSTELRDVTFKDLPNESGIYMLNIWFDYDGEELNFGDDFKKICEYSHKWNKYDVCSVCGIQKTEWKSVCRRWFPLLVKIKNDTNF